MSAIFEQHPDADPPTLKVVGEVDLANARDLNIALQELARGRTTPIRLDLSEVYYFDSAAIKVVFDHALRGELHLRIKPDATIAKTISTSGLHAIVKLEQAEG